MVSILKSSLFYSSPVCLCTGYTCQVTVSLFLSVACDLIVILPALSVLVRTSADTSFLAGRGLLKLYRYRRYKDRRFYMCRSAQVSQRRYPYAWINAIEQPASTNHIYSLD